MLSEGFLVSLQIFAFTLLGSLPLGMLVAFAAQCAASSRARFSPACTSPSCAAPRSCCRCLPSTLSPYYVFGIRLTTDSKWYATIVAFIINYAAYFAEIYRSGIQSSRAASTRPPRSWATRGRRPSAASCCRR